MKQFESINFGGCSVNSFTVSVLFFSGSICTITDYFDGFDPNNVTIYSEKWEAVDNFTLIIDIFNGD